MSQIRKENGKQDLRVARRERRRAQVRNEILEATRTILTREGTSGFTLEAVAQELQLTKAALYYYFPSKDALLFEAVHSELRSEAERIAKAVEPAASGKAALRTLIETSFEHYRGRLDAFRLAYLYQQVAGPETVHPTAEMLEAVRPINDLIYGSVQRKLESDGGETTEEERSQMRRLAFLAHMAVLGVLTMKGMVEAFEDPLVHSDEELLADLVSAFEAASEAPSKS